MLLDYRVVVFQSRCTILNSQQQQVKDPAALKSSKYLVLSRRFCFVLLLAVLESEPRALCMLGKGSILAHLVLSVFCVLVTLVGIQCSIIVVLICISLRHSEVEHIFVYLFAYFL
jgi:hypothetical protein